jgi:small subunit ribosomal protein S20
MANSKGAEKRVRTNATKALQNKMAKSSLKTAIKAFYAKIEAEPSNAQAAYNEIASKVDSACSNGILHKNTAARRKSAFAKAVTAATKSA